MHRSLLALVIRERTQEFYSVTSFLPKTNVAVVYTFRRRKITHISFEILSLQRRAVTISHI